MKRRSYRKSPGRQYGYDYDPLQKKSGSLAKQTGSLLAQRPDPRRARQFLRQSIIASKRPPNATRDLLLPQEQRIATASLEEPVRISRLTRRDPQRHVRGTKSITPPSRLQMTRSSRSLSQEIPYVKDFARTAHLAEHHAPKTRELPPDEPEMYEAWDDLADAHIIESNALAPRRRDPRYERSDVDEMIEDDYDPNRIYEEEDELPPDLHIVKEHKRVSRRGLLIGGGLLAAGGGLFVAAEGPKVASQIDHTSHAIQDAFNRGVAQGADATRQEFVSALDSLEGFSLQGAIEAAKLMRVAYDVFISPVVQFGSQLANDFLSAMLQAFKTARGWLQNVGQDNATLAAIQQVLQSWADQVSKLPKQLDAITQTDLDGTQAYLAALQRKIASEKAKLNQPQTPTPTNQPTAQAKSP